MELKPCPFCGGDAEVRHSVTCGYDSYWVECKDFQNCRGSVSPVTDVESVAVEAWNTRHVETCTIGDYKDPDYGYTHDAMWNDEWFMPSGRCSGCGEYIPVWNYCPKCGRKVVES